MRNSPSIRAAATVAIAALTGCGHTVPAGTPAAGPAPFTRVLRLDQLYVLEMRGPAVDDTTVTFRTGALRRVILWHGAPDYTPFVELVFPAEAFAAPGLPDSVTVTVHPRPGVYGIDLTSSTPPGRGAQIRFSYPVHFAAPIAALKRYSDAGGVERALSIAVQVGDGRYGLLASERPALDNLQAELRGAGTYLVVAPR